jgi:putative ABC transport system permease protein
MTIGTIAWKYLCGRWLASALTVFSVALGVSLVLATWLLTGGIREGFIAGTTDYNLIVGAKGSATQLVLNTIFRMDTPTPNILYPVYARLQDDARVDVAVPVALGDAYQGFRYVATTTAYFASLPWRRKTFTVSTGRLWRDDPVTAPTYEALLGADVAQQTGLEIGDRFYEGEEMAEYPLTVVGILRPTHSADDQTIFFSLASFWEMNELSRSTQVKPLTAVLVRPKRLSDLPSLHREFNGHEATQAVFPSAVLLNIFTVLSLVEEMFNYLLGMVMLVVLLYLFVSLYGATLERKREIATMRALGARRATILAIILLESCLITLFGGVLGLLGGHGFAALGSYVLVQRGGWALPPAPIGLLQPLVLVAVVLLGMAAGLLPAVLAYRTEVAENLAPLS